MFINIIHINYISYFMHVNIKHFILPIVFLFLRFISFCYKMLRISIDKNSMTKSVMV